MVDFEQRLGVVMQEFASMLDDPAGGHHHLSPQLSRKLAQLVDCWYRGPKTHEEIANKLAAVFGRLLLELVQAQFNTKRREQDLVRLVESKGCSLRDPDLLDRVCELLTRLYRAAGQCTDTSFERQVLIKYLLKELEDVPLQGNRKRQVERVVQTIYKCSCFHVTQQNGAPSRLSLKEELYDAVKLRDNINCEIIKMAQSEGGIRLSPDSWIYLLHGRATFDLTARVQAILDSHQSQVDVDELRDALCQSGDKMHLERHLADLYAIQDQTGQIRSQLSTVSAITNNCCNLLRDTLERLANLRHLFSVRQDRTKWLAN